MFRKAVSGGKRVVLVGLVVGLALLLGEYGGSTLIATQSDDDWRWKTGTSGVGGDIYHTGNVGIGTTEPGAKLEIVNSSHDRYEKGEKLVESVVVTRKVETTGQENPLDEDGNEDVDPNVDWNPFFALRVTATDDIAAKDPNDPNDPMKNTGWAGGISSAGYLGGTGKLGSSMGARIDTGPYCGGGPNQPCGRVEYAEAVLARVITHGKGTIGEGYGVYVDVFDYHDKKGTHPSQIGKGYGIYVNRVRGTENTYGVYINPMDDKSKQRWGVYQLGARDSNYFAGKVGIGIDTPDAPLDVRRENDGANQVVGFFSNSSDSSGSQVSIDLGVGTNFPTTWRLTGTGENLQIGNAVAATPAITILGNGNVGIWTTDPQSTLQVEGGYLQIDSGLNQSPDKADCDPNHHIGRLFLEDGTFSPVLWVCTSKGWTYASLKSPSP